MANTAQIKAVITAEDKASATIKGVGDNVKDTANKSAIALGVAGAGLTAFAKSATEFTTDYVKNARQLSRETGNTIETSSRLLFVTNRLGISAEEASQEFGIFSKKIVAADDSFNKLGVTLKDSSGKQRSFNDILLDTADKFRALPDGVEKTTISMDLFGRSGKDMIKVLNLGSQGISDLEKQADKLGLTLTESNVNAIAKYIESQKNLKDSTDAMKFAVGEATSPVLTSFNNVLNSIIGSLIGTDSATRGVTAAFLAFTGPVLLGASALLAFLANLGTVVQTAGVTRAAIVGLYSTIIANGAVIVAFGAVAAAAVAAGILIVNAGNQAKQAWDNTRNAITQAGNSNDEVIRRLQAQVKAGTLSGDKAAAIIRSMSGARAEGGMVLAGHTYLVNENTPNSEYFTPNQTGVVTPRQQGEGNTIYNITVQAGAFMGSQQDARKYAQLIMRAWGDLQGSKGATA